MCLLRLKYFQGKVKQSPLKTSPSSIIYSVAYNIYNYFKAFSKKYSKFLFMSKNKQVETVFKIVSKTTKFSCHVK